MSQHDFDIANQTASNTRVDINNALKALGSLSSGNSAPSTTYANMLWYETDSNWLWVRNEADSAWIRFAYLDQSSNKIALTDNTSIVGNGGVQSGLLGDQSTATWQAGTGTLDSLASPANIKAAILAQSPTATLSSTQNTTSGSSVDFTGIPSTATEIDVYFIGYTNTGTSRVQFRVGGSVVTSGYYSSSGSSGAETGAKTDGFAIYNDGVTRQHNGIMSLRKAASGTWVESHSLTAGGAEVSGGGNCTGLGAVDGIRVKATGVFQAGKISIRWK